MFYLHRLFLPLACLLFTLSGCDLAFPISKVNPALSDQAKVRVVEMTPEAVLGANRSTYVPKNLPAIFYNAASTQPSGYGGGTTPAPVVDESLRPAYLEQRLPPEKNRIAYTIGVGDVLLLATPSSNSSVEQLSGLLAATNSRQGYTVQDDGAIAIPNIGRVAVEGLDLERAEALLFQTLVNRQIDPSFSLEISEFNSKKVAIGGAVERSTVVPITLTPLYLDTALAAAGGVTTNDLDYASIRIYRDGTLYQIPLRGLYSNSDLKKIPLYDGDSIFVDTEFELTRAQAYFSQQIQLANFKRSTRTNALSVLNSEISLRRSALTEQRSLYQARLQSGAVDRDYVYLTGEVFEQSRYTLPFANKASLADALYEQGGLSRSSSNPKQVYVLRGSADPREFGALTAYRLDLSNAANLIIATQFELRPNDIIFVATQSITHWNRVITQLTPTLFNQALSTASVLGVDF